MSSTIITGVLLRSDNVIVSIPQYEPADKLVRSIYHPKTNIDNGHNDLVAALCLYASVMNNNTEENTANIRKICGCDIYLYTAQGKTQEKRVGDVEALGEIRDTETFYVFLGDSCLEKAMHAQRKSKHWTQRTKTLWQHVDGRKLQPAVGPDDVCKESWHL